MYRHNKRKSNLNSKIIKNKIQGLSTTIKKINNVPLGLIFEYLKNYIIINMIMINYRPKSNIYIYIYINTIIQYKSKKLDLII